MTKGWRVVLDARYPPEASCMEEDCDFRVPPSENTRARARHHVTEEGHRVRVVVRIEQHYAPDRTATPARPIGDL
jgi:hypothetical protein